MSFVATYGGNTNTMRHSGMKGLQAAINAGMTISQIQAQTAREGVSFGHEAQNYINARAGTFIGKYGGNEDTMRHAGLQAVTAASAAGLSYDEMRRQAAAEGVQFQSGAQDLFRAYDGRKEFENQMSSLQASMAQQQQTYQDNLSQMKNTLQAQLNPNTTESVLGVKGAGGEKSQSQRRGLKGSFGRGGLRIKSLNI